MQYKTTRRLFYGTYQYKIVLVCAGAQMFRANDMASTILQLQKIDITDKSVPPWRNTHIKTQDELDYAFKLQAVLSQLTDVELRVESPWISIYTNSKTDVDILTKLDESKVKYISAPLPNTGLSCDTVIMPKINFEFKVTLGRTTQEHSAFITWATGNKKLRLTESCVIALNRPRSWGGTYFYITGDNNLLMARMHLGGSIGKVERIVKQ